MKALSRAVVIAITAVLSSAPNVLAQYAQPVAVQADVRAMAERVQVGQDVQVRPSKAPYLIGGAIGGAVITAVAFARESEKNSSEGAAFGGLVAGIGTVVGALLGAGIGWLVYEVRH